MFDLLPKFVVISFSVLFDVCGYYCLVDMCSFTCTLVEFALMIAAPDVLILCSLVGWIYKPRVLLLQHRLVLIVTSCEHSSEDRATYWSKKLLNRSMPNGSDLRQTRKKLYETRRAVQQSVYRRKSSSSGMVWSPISLSSMPFLPLLTTLAASAPSNDGVNPRRINSSSLN